MGSIADLNCTLRVNARCVECKMKIMQLLTSIRGVYNVTIDAEEGTVKVSGEVDPNLLMRTLMQSGTHAELVWANIKHPALNRSGSQNDYVRSSSLDHSLPCCNSYGGSRSYSNRITDEHSVPEQSYLYQQMMGPLPPARYVSGNPVPLECNSHEYAGHGAGKSALEYDSHENDRYVPRNPIPDYDYAHAREPVCCPMM